MRNFPDTQTQKKILVKNTHLNLSVLFLHMNSVSVLQNQINQIKICELKLFIKNPKLTKTLDVLSSMCEMIQIVTATRYGPTFDGVCPIPLHALFYLHLFVTVTVASCA